jgi:hypothetical protein
VDDFDISGHALIPVPSAAIDASLHDVLLVLRLIDKEREFLTEREGHWLPAAWRSFLPF